MDPKTTVKHGGIIIPKAFLARVLTETTLLTPDALANEIGSMRDARASAQCISNFDPNSQGRKGFTIVTDAIMSENPIMAAYQRGRDTKAYSAEEKNKHGARRAKGFVRSTSRDNTFPTPNPFGSA